jgi:hypothetical protein
MSGFPKVAVASNPALQYNDLLGWTYDPAMAGATGVTLSAAATLQLGRIPLPAAMTVTNVIVNGGSVPGVTLTHSYLALFKSDGTIIGQTADQSTPWQSASYAIDVLPLVGGPYVCTPLGANDFLWPAVYVGTAVTLPSFYGLANTALPAFQLPVSVARSRQGRIAQANTATLTSIVPANIAQNYMSIWMGIS